MAQPAHLYFHSPCFDGVVSAVLASGFLEEKWQWPHLTLHSVNYALRHEWLSMELLRPCAVVDFLYHPQAEFWADHHVTAFLNERSREDFQRRGGSNLVYDEGAPSCAELLWNHFSEKFDHRNPRYLELVSWATKIDSAQYESVEEVVRPKAPALRINLGLAGPDSRETCERLVWALRSQTLDAVADLPEFRSRYERAQSLVEVGLQRFSESARIENDGIVVFDVKSERAIINRYSPYCFFPDARYSVGIIRFEKYAKITAMSNPWRHFESVCLGPIFEKIGGGGHRRVGSAVLKGEALDRAPSLLANVLSEIRNQERIPAESPAL